VITLPDPRRCPPSWRHRPARAAAGATLRWLAVPLAGATLIALSAPSDAATVKTSHSTHRAKGHKPKKSGRPSTSTPGDSGQTKLAEMGTGTFWECPASTTSILIGVNRLDLHPGQVLTVNFLVKNGGATACNYVAPYAGSTSGPVASTLELGPCGSMAFEIQGARHKNVWPGLTTFNCPALGFAQLAPGATVVGTGSWAQTMPTGLKRVPTGSYTLVVDGHFDFALHIDAH